MEEMRSFFASRIDGYDEHMVNDVEGCKEGYKLMAELVPSTCDTLLDLGCGTGLELEGILKNNPSLKVTAIDLTPEMLEVLTEKFKDYDINVICGDYFKADFGVSRYDTAISFETMHHFEKDAKVELYRRILLALKDDGRYIECDYMVETTEEENLYFEEFRAFKQNAKNDVYYHFDTPCTIENQILMLKKAGFKEVEKVFKKGGTVILVAKK